jgi:3-methyladenine DNA glycosylase AlkD
LTSDVSARAAALVADRLLAAQALGSDLADLIDDPEAFVSTLRRGLQRLSDPGYAAEQERVAPGSGETIGVRWPLVHAVERALRGPLRQSSSASALWLAQRLVRDQVREIRLFALPCLRRALPDDPERSWQLLRRLARGANDWISVDTIAETWAHGVLAETFRWAELEQLVYSDRRMERRLVGSTLARVPHAVPRARRAALPTPRALALVGTLIGDADDQVQKALSWALREWSRVDRRAVGRFLEEQAGIAVTNDDGARAWVVRDALSHQPAPLANDLRFRLAGIRRRAGAPSTSEAARAAAEFGLASLSDRVVAQQGERYARRLP